MIKIVKASAGSGKTFSLAKQYISLLLSKKDDYPYRHILAVTFTNKATEEMKTRILNELFVLSTNPGSSPYYNDFIGMFPDAKAMSDRAKRILCGILHDYGSFSVSTIDKFFQQTLRAFSREIGQFASYQVELDKSALLTEAVDRILDSLTEDEPDTLKWLTESALDQIKQGGRYNLDKQLYSMAERLRKEEHRVKFEESGMNEAQAYDRENLSEIKKKCDGVISNFEKSVGSAANAVVNAIEAAGRRVEEFKPFMKYINDYIPKNSASGPSKKLEMPKDTFMNNARVPEKWFTKANSALMPANVDQLLTPLNTFCDLFEGKGYKEYLTARIIKDQIYGLGITGELDKEFSALLKEKNVLSIDDSNLILNKIIGESDAPFIYEKTGVKYENFLLDEFQDTSVIQWKNISPLLHESEGYNHENFIVGDVKQSIYRWRGSDWKMLDSGLEKEFGGDHVDPSTLKVNYRSYRNIVNFNNTFFDAAAGELDRMIGEENFICRLYADVEQKCNSREEGFVKMTFCDKDKQLDKVLDAINEIMAIEGPQRPKYGDIAVLVRKNSDGAAVARHLIENNIKVVTDDSLKVKSSVTVNRIVSMLSYVDNPDDTVGSYLATTLNIKAPKEYHSLVDLCEELIRGVKKYDEETFASEVAYVQSFVDAVSDYSRTKGNNLHGFLSNWSEVDPAISSPSEEDSVRIITVHKAKGLDFPYVIFPFVEAVPLFRPDSHWCVPDTGEADLLKECKNVYDVNLSSKTESTLFAKDYREERKKQLVDNINVLYVALTRAVGGMYIIGEMPSAKVLSYKGLAVAEDPAGSKWPEFSKFSHALYLFAKDNTGKGIGLQHEDGDGVETFTLGEMCPVAGKKSGGAVEQILSSYPSWPINPEGEPMRLLLNQDSSDFFSEDGRVGGGASARLRGIILHNILSAVNRPEDLDAAVEQAVVNGEIDSVEAAEAKALLKQRLESAVARGWFAADAKVYNEAELIDSDGNAYRPDRVEVRQDGSEVLIIDYKFGKHYPSYLKQIAGYADMWKKMGYSKVSAALWYVPADEIEIVG